ncbi:hypothetical protein AO391_00890 [Pseudomonas marginalis ICMP 9505]|uniref:Uncharacterized protein n=1 Tax=Pseudomonas kitaguniensis TaxID=2607908 RepID=A0A5N7JPA8_9PSED|nr:MULTISPECIES: hypothetical protein [Pseudomonas]KTC17539.1 hypothetical protein AO391_00890 [Pseudomonas marginalis ICMP 9505]RMP59493.1 hypothetical protein ALQ18_01329 [Pseudomonas marginalis pv. marginalis]MPQ83145.1 hypothetical protein [Pseudomonas kitaguniensis]MPR03129.1 hypothetical protein [Pseudomonas kitaguniensis]PHN30220.1 hypothetical protein AO240_10125 [Pseudomonas sp. ICMP 460]
MKTFQELLNNWEEKGAEAQDLVEINVSIHKADLVKIKAFAEVYGLSESTITATLLSTSIKEAEEAIPYVKGSEVIRVEEGEDIFADAGKTPAYVEAEQKIHKSMLTNS